MLFKIVYIFVFGTGTAASELKNKVNSVIKARCSYFTISANVLVSLRF